MARGLHRLTAKEVEHFGGPGRLADGGGLYLVVTPALNGRRWVLRYVSPVTKKMRETGLGTAGRHGVGLREARQRAAEIRAKVRDGIDPLEDTPRVAVPTFDEVASEFIDSMEAGWRNPKHRYQWRQTIATYAAPLHKKRVDSITVDDVLEVLRPIWHRKAETATRLRGRVERILDYAKTRGWRSGENPAAWKGNLALALPPAGKLKRGHMGAMPYADVPAFFWTLTARRGVAAMALRFLILTAARSGEVRGMTWGEVDGDVWTVPGERMKAGREHRVPLSAPALEILAAMKELPADPAGLVFPSSKPGKPLSDMAMTALLRRAKLDGITAHGFRSSFSTWTAETTAFPEEVREAALAHVTGNKVVMAYQRGDLFSKRRELMDAWAIYLTTEKPAR